MWHGVAGCTPGVRCNGTCPGTRHRIAPLPRLLKEAGYHTYTSSKWPLPVLAGAAAAVHGSTCVTAMYHAGHAFLREGRWELVNLEPPFDESGSV